MNLWRSVLQRTFIAFSLILIPSAASYAQGTQVAPPRVVLKGHDPVAYFTDGKLVKGKPSISYDWDEGRYYFANARNRKMFSADPERYAPQFSGYCTGSMSRGVRNEGDPEAWIIADGRLYVFGAVKFRDVAEKDREKLAVWIAGANNNWREKK